MVTPLNSTVCAIGRYAVLKSGKCEGIVVQAVIFCCKMTRLMDYDHVH